MKEKENTLNKGNFCINFQIFTTDLYPDMSEHIAKSDNRVEDRFSQVRAVEHNEISQR